MIRDVFKDFLKFLKKHNIVALAVGFMIAKNITLLTKSAVDNVFNPLLDPVIKQLDDVDLKSWDLEVGPFDIKVGAFLSDSIEFLLLGILVVVISNAAERLL